MEEARVVEKAHRQAVLASMADVATYLQELLSRRLVAYIAGEGCEDGYSLGERRSRKRPPGQRGAFADSL